MSAKVLAQVLLLLAASFPGVRSTTSHILPPVGGASGEEVAVIFVPGAGIKGEAYEPTGRALQQAAKDIRLWIALTGNYTFNTPNPLQLSSAIDRAISGLKKMGMKGDNYVGAAHSLGGVFLAPYAKSSRLKAVILLGAYLTHGNPLRQYPLPVLTLSGELDGQTRITRIAETYKELNDEVENFNNQSAMFLTPVINIKGSCHAQFASGPMPAEVRKYDLQPDISDDDAHRAMGGHMTSFISAVFNIGNVTEAKQNLSNAYDETGDRLSPLLSGLDLDQPSGRMPAWIVIQQMRVASNFATKIQVFPSFEQNQPSFATTSPTVKKIDNGNQLSINVVNLIVYPFNPMDISTNPSSPQETDLKMASYDVIKLNLKLSNETPTFNITDCKELNQYALKTARDNASPEALSRYMKNSRLLQLEDDVTCASDLEWEKTPLSLDERDDGLHVKAVTYKTASVFYCKVMSPYRALEWIYVDSLRKHKP